MTRVVIVGEIYNADLSIGGGPIIPPTQPPLGIWGPTDPRPTHPIAPGGPPLGIWGGGNVPYPTPPIYYPGAPVYPDQGLPRPPGIPSHPIYNPPYPDQGLPGSQPRPTHPIVLPPPPGSGAPPIAAQLPVFPPEATHPIVLPPEVAPPTTPDGRPIDWQVAWSPATGWIVVGVPNVPVPTPSAG